MPTTPAPHDFPPEPDVAEALSHAAVFRELVEAARARDTDAVSELLLDYLDFNGAPFTAELHCRYLAATGALLTASYMDRRGAPVSRTWSRITAHLPAASRPERAAVRAIAAHRAGDDAASQATQLALIDDGGHQALLEMVLVVLRICAEVTRPS